MKFYMDSIDTVDPNYDFLEERSKPNRDIYWDDQYPHEYLGKAPYDGLLAMGIVGDHKLQGIHTISINEISKSWSTRILRINVKNLSI